MNQNLYYMNHSYFNTKLQVIFSHEMILAAQSPIFRRSLRQGVPSDCKWSSTIVEAFLNFLYGIDSHIKEKYQIVELLLCATYYQVCLSSID